MSAVQYCVRCVDDDGDNRLKSSFDLTAELWNLKKKEVFYLNKTKKIVLSGLFIALSILLSWVFSMQFNIAGVPASRLAVGFIPIMLAGIILGPYFGMAVGALADVLCFIFVFKGIYYPPITVTSMLVGLLPYLALKFTGKLKYCIRIFIAVAFTLIICSIFLQTLWLSQLYGKSYGVLFFPRALVAVFTIPVYSFIIYSVMFALKKTEFIKQE